MRQKRNAACACVQGFAKLPKAKLSNYSLILSHSSVASCHEGWGSHGPRWKQPGRSRTGARPIRLVINNSPSSPSFSLYGVLKKKKMLIARGNKAKLYPTKSQKEALVAYLGVARFTYNYLLALKADVYRDAGVNIGYAALCREIRWMRQEYPWMLAVSCDIQHQAVRDLDQTYKNFFSKRTSYPKFKKKGMPMSFRKPKRWKILGNKIRISPGLSVKFRGRFEEGGMLTVSVDSMGVWWASTITKKETATPTLKDAVLGIDLGLNHLAITSDGEKFENLKLVRGLEKRLKTASQALSRRKKGSRRRAKAKLKVAKLHQKVANQRKNHLHHVSRSIVGKNHATIALEDLAVAQMGKARSLAKAIHDASWSELVRQLTYKQDWNGGKTVKIDRFYPSSKTCSACLFVLKELPLSVRDWTCPNCGATHDRDINAAKNIRTAGERQGVESAKEPRKRNIIGSKKRGPERQDSKRKKRRTVIDRVKPESRKE